MSSREKYKVCCMWACVGVLLNYKYIKIRSAGLCSLKLIFVFLNVFISILKKENAMYHNCYYCLYKKKIIIVARRKEGGIFGFTKISKWFFVMFSFVV